MLVRIKNYHFSTKNIKTGNGTFVSLYYEKKKMIYSNKSLRFLLSIKYIIYKLVKR